MAGITNLIQSASIVESCERFVSWLESRVVGAGRGDREMHMDVEPSGKLWLGRLASEESVIQSGLHERGERLDPCAIGMRILPENRGPWTIKAELSFCVWLRDQARLWDKSERVSVRFDVTISERLGTQSHGSAAVEAACLRTFGVQGFVAELRSEIIQLPTGQAELSLTAVNITPAEVKGIRDSNLYEVILTVEALPTIPYQLEAIPDSFRYDRRVEAYGINCGVEYLNGRFQTTDAIGVDKLRPSFWNASDAEPDLSFRALSKDPVTSANMLIKALSNWGELAWSSNALDTSAHHENWTPEMRAEADTAASDFFAELERIRHGARLIQERPDIRKAFCLMNRAMDYSARGRYSNWRPFQFGFLLANLASIANVELESEIVDIVWFATGGGKTETYLGLIITAALFDRLRGKTSGITAWSRFPLRMLSLQQTQRFANALAGAEMVRIEENISGDPFAVGFFVGNNATPNKIPSNPKDYEPDPDDLEMPNRYRVLLECPFCRSSKVGMRFNRLSWQLEHRCGSSDCAWGDRALPFYVVDQEIFRFLPTVIVGTLDKAAIIAMQASMRGFVGSPLGQCSVAGHGFTYAPRAERRNGCLVPGCPGTSRPLSMPAEMFGPSFRLQDELHLLRDSLGAVDAHYESILDDLQRALCGRVPKILASSATLTGYQKQVNVIYKRQARVFPVPGPSVQKGFWTSDSSSLMRRFVGLAPRGVTLEYATDRILTELQAAVRLLLSDPQPVCAQLRIPPEHVPELVSYYGTDVVYGNSLRDLDAVMRSAQSQIRVDGPVNSQELTGKTDFERVRQTLSQLDSPPDDFGERIHVVVASSMMSHGVDIDRLNVMCVLGLPLATAEFLQATARVGRRWPGLVFVMHKIGRERDASVYRSFPKFIEQGDRFVEAIPVTRRSRRVLEQTIAGLELARIWMLHEPNSGESLAMVRKLREFFVRSGVTAQSEAVALTDALQLHEALDEPSRKDLEDWMARFFRTLMDPGGTILFPGQLSHTGEPMRSLRDVEEQVPIHGSEIR